jgi:hypothetical protein
VLLGRSPQSGLIVQIKRASRRSDEAPGHHHHDVGAGRA